VRPEGFSTSKSENHPMTLQNNDTNRTESPQKISKGDDPNSLDEAIHLIMAERIHETPKSRPTSQPKSQSMQSPVQSAHEKADNSSNAPLPNPPVDNDIPTIPRQPCLPSGVQISLAALELFREVASSIGEEDESYFDETEAKISSPQRKQGIVEEQRSRKRLREEEEQAKMGQGQILSDFQRMPNITDSDSEVNLDSDMDNDTDQDHDENSSNKRQKGQVKSSLTSSTRVITTSTTAFPSRFDRAGNVTSFRSANNKYEKEAPLQHDLTGPSIRSRRYQQ